MNGLIITFIAAVIGILMIVPVQATEIKFRLKNAPPVVFNHDTHLAKHKDCKICHSTIFVLGNKRPYSMIEMEKGFSCGACHNGKNTIFSVSTEKDCSKCHRGTPGTVAYPAGNAIFSHDTHYNSKRYGCKNCHTGGPIRRGVSMTEMVKKGRSCGSCHNGKTAFTAAANCDICHRRGRTTKHIPWSM